MFADEATFLFGVLGKMEPAWGGSRDIAGAPNLGGAAAPPRLVDSSWRLFSGFEFPTRRQVDDAMTVVHGQHSQVKLPGSWWQVVQDAGLFIAQYAACSLSVGGAVIAGSSGFTLGKMVAASNFLDAARVGGWILGATAVSYVLWNSAKTIHNMRARAAQSWKSLREILGVQEVINPLERYLESENRTALAAVRSLPGFVDRLDRESDEPISAEERRNIGDRFIDIAQAVDGYTAKIAAQVSSEDPCNANLEQLNRMAVCLRLVAKRLGR